MVTLAVSLLVVLAVAGLVVFQHFAQGTEPAVIEVAPRLEGVREEGELFYLPVDVENGGDMPVEDVAVELTLNMEGEEPETAQFVVPFLAGDESDEYTVSFPMDPRQGEISHTITFHEP
jgi:uncharacterized protein (TIGR02588 family)